MEKKTITCKICNLTDSLRTPETFDSPSDMNEDLHKGFTIGNGNTLYWTIRWTTWGNAVVYSKDNDSKRWVSGDQIITIHFK